LVNLLSGVSPIVHIAGPLRPWVANVANGFALIVLLAGAAWGWRSFRSQRHALWLAAGAVMAFAGFHVVAMDAAVYPPTERYSMFMLVPMFILLALSLSAMIDRHAMSGWFTAGATVAGLTALLAGGYFYPLAVDGGDAMTTYRTATSEPKRAAFDFIQADSQGRSTRVITEGWWLYWTLRYFSTPHGRIHVEPTPDSSMPGGIRPAGVAPEPAVTPPPQRTYVVVFAGSRYPATVHASAPLFTANDPIGRPIVQVFSADLP
jgi:hypothetical protein